MSRVVSSGDQTNFSALLPVQLTSFVGRDGAMSEIARLFTSARLVTLTGAGGCGKTRLALQVVPSLCQGLGCEAAWVDLASLSDPSLIPQSIARATNAVDVADGPLLEAVLAALRPRHLLLVLDNGEHLIDAVALIAEQMLLACPSIWLLVTSREALNIAGETAWNVPPLSLPFQHDDLASAQATEAVRLFVDRARAAVPSFALTAENTSAVVEICRRLDGMPLAIELAASRLQLFSITEIAARLEQCFSLLTAGRRTALPRHQTLQATIDWSYALLSEPERLLFARLSVFSGGFTLDAVEAVCHGDGLEPGRMLDLLAHLVDKSLVVVEKRGEATRYRLLETIRQYSSGKLGESGSQSVLRDRHAEWCARLTEQVAELETSGQAALIDRLEAEHDNIRAAMRWAIESNDAEMLGRIAAHLWRFWLMRGYLREGARWLAETARLLPEFAPIRIDALLGAGVLTCHQADYVKSTEFFGEALAVCRAAGKRNSEGQVLYGLATVKLYQGRYAEAAQDFEASLPLFDHDRGRALSLMGLAMTLLYANELERAATLCQQSLDLCLQIGDERSIAGALTSLGMIALARGDQVGAEAACRRSLDIRRDVGDRGGIAHTLTVIGSMLLQRGDDEDALHCFSEALSLRRETSDLSGTAGPLEGIAAVAATRGDASRAAYLFGAADAFRARHDTPTSPIERAFRERFLAMAGETLDTAELEQQLTAGRAAEPETVLQLALLVTPRATLPDEPAEQFADASSPVKPPELDVHTLGATVITLNGREIDASEWTYTKARELLLYLMRTGPSTKEQIGLALWPDASESQLRSSFHTTLHHLRRALRAPDWIVYRNGRYAFNRSRSYRDDAGLFEQEVSRARRLVSTDRPAAIALLTGAVDRYTGPYLSDLNDAEWSLPIRERFEQAYLDSLLLLAELLVATEEYGRATAVYRRAIAADQFLESAHRGLMQCFAMQGERGQALRHYHDLCHVLRNELSAEPDAKTRDLFERLRRQPSPA